MTATREALETILFGPELYRNGSGKNLLQHQQQQQHLHQSQRRRRRDSWPPSNLAAEGCSGIFFAFEAEDDDNNQSREEEDHEQEHEQDKSKEDSCETSLVPLKNNSSSNSDGGGNSNSNNNNVSIDQEDETFRAESPNKKMKTTSLKLRSATPVMAVGAAGMAALPLGRKLRLAAGSGIFRHYYPEGDWGFVVLSCATLAQFLASGMQLSFGVLAFFAQIRFRSRDFVQMGK